MGKAINNNIYEFLINGEIVATGTYQMIADKLGITRNNLMTKLSHSKVGRYKKYHYEARLVVSNEKIYSLYEGRKKIGEGTIKDLEEKTHYSYQYLKSLANGWIDRQRKGKYKKKENQLSMRRVG